MKILDADATAAALPWADLIAAIDAVLVDARAGGVQCPSRSVLPITDHDVWLLMPAWSRAADVAACKLVTVHHDNPARGLPLIQGDVLTIRASTGERLLMLDGPTVTGRRTAAVSLYALRGLLARRPQPAAGLTVLIVGGGVQGQNHLDAAATLLPLARVLVNSRQRPAAEAMAARARAAGIDADVVESVDDAVPRADLILLCTPAGATCLNVMPKPGTLVAAVGAYKATMAEIAAKVVRGFGRNILLDSSDVVHEGGDLLMAGVDPTGLPTLLDGPGSPALDPNRSLLFKSCGSALWDLAAATAAARRLPA